MPSSSHLVDEVLYGSFHITRYLVPNSAQSIPLIILPHLLLQLTIRDLPSRSLSPIPFLSPTLERCQVLASHIVTLSYTARHYPDTDDLWRDRAIYSQLTFTHLIPTLSFYKLLPSTTPSFLPFGNVYIFT